MLAVGIDSHIIESSDQELKGELPSFAEETNYESNPFDEQQLARNVQFPFLNKVAMFQWKWSIVWLAF